MKKQLIQMCVLVAAACAASVPGLSQTSQMSQIQVKVPFSFSVGSTTLPAGEYSLHENVSGVIFIYSAELRRSIGILTSADNVNKANDAALRFEKVDGRYSLSEVVMASEPSRRIRPSVKSK